MRILISKTGQIPMTKMLAKRNPSYVLTANSVKGLEECPAEALIYLK